MNRHLPTLGYISLSSKLRLGMLTTLLLAISRVLIVVVPASYSANPTSGSISEASPLVTWTGQIKPADGFSGLRGAKQRGRAKTST